MHPGKHEDEGFPGCIIQYFTRLTSNNYGDFSGQPQPALDAPDRNNPAWARMGSDIPQELNDTQSFANPILNKKAAYHVHYRESPTNPPCRLLLDYTAAPEDRRFHLQVSASLVVALLARGRNYSRVCTE